MPVYLIHLERKHYHSQHYIGYAAKGNVKRRLSHHRAGRGARFLAAMNGLGIVYTVVRTWKKGDRTFERILKNRKNASRLCPACRSIKLLEQLEDDRAGRNELRAKG